jgi:hypothetical protein
MPRPSITKTIVADTDGKLTFWIDGQLSGDDEQLLERIRLAEFVGATTSLTRGGDEIEADLTTPVGAAAALLLASPGRTRLLEVPQEVLDLYPDENEDDYLNDPADEIELVNDDEGNRTEYV